MLRRIQIGLRLLLGLAFFAVFGVIFVLVVFASPTTIVAPTPRPTTPSTPTTSSPTTSSPTTSTNKTSTTSESKRTTTSTSPTPQTPPSTSPCTTASMTTVTTSPDMPISNSTGDNTKSYLQSQHHTRLGCQIFIFWQKYGNVQKKQLMIIIALPHY